MNAPNKIYIAQATFPDKIDWDGSPINTQRVEDTDVQYIRKNALLEWLNQRKKLMEEEIGFGLSIDDVIDKLNSL